VSCRGANVGRRLAIAPVQDTGAREAKYSGDYDIAKAVCGPRVLQQFVHAEVGVVFCRQNSVSTMYAKIDDSKAEGYKLGVSRTSTLDISDKTPHGLSACAYQEYQEHKSESDFAKTSMGNMIMA
jgi:hypothetical protein